MFKQLLCWEKLAQCYVKTKSRCEHEKKLRKRKEKRNGLWRSKNTKHRGIEFLVTV